MEEVLVSEILARVVAALGAGIDERSADEEISPVTHAILLNHLEASNRVHQIILKARGAAVTKAERLNRVRQGIESWTDVLIGSDVDTHCRARSVRHRSQKSNGIRRRGFPAGPRSHA